MWTEKKGGMKREAYAHVISSNSWVSALSASKYLYSAKDSL